MTTTTGDHRDVGEIHRGLTGTMMIAVEVTATGDSGIVAIGMMMMMMTGDGEIVAGGMMTMTTAGDSGIVATGANERDLS